MKYIKFFKELNNRDVPLVGGKNASIGEMFQELVPVGIKVPDGFAITSDAYWYLLKSGGIEDKIIVAVRFENLFLAPHYPKI